jgi:hypothetical protein
MNYNAAYCESSLAPATARLLSRPSNSVVGGGGGAVVHRQVSQSTNTRKMGRLLVPRRAAFTS